MIRLDGTAAESSLRGQDEAKRGQDRGQDDGLRGQDRGQDEATRGQDESYVLSLVDKLILAIGEETLSRQEIMERLGIRSRDKFRELYKEPAQNDEMISLTIPDKPTSGNQKYFLSEKGLVQLAKLRK